ncbi:MAG: AAA family ATPase [Pseudomonadota bacterium]
MTQHEHPAFIRALRKPGAWPHPVDDVELVETHISWVLLAGEHAYKFKKPVNFGFVDFSSLHLRRYYCREELRRNQPLAAELYEAVITLSGDPEAPLIEADGEETEPAFEYGVRMRRFDEAHRLDRMLAAGQLDAEALEDFARRLAQFHQEAAVASRQTVNGTPEAVIAPARDNIRGLQALLRDRPELREASSDALERVGAWTEEAYRVLAPTMAARRAEGFIRECHGDLHLGNLTWHSDRVIAFDCIEFNPDFYWIDVINEIAFLVMDTADRGHPELGRRALNRYLEWTGDYNGVALLDFYRVYRAMVRARVAGLRLEQTEGDKARKVCDEITDYLDLAATFIRPHPPWLALTHGLSGSGKSRVSREIVASGDAIRLRSDVERKRLHGLSPDARTDSGVAAGLYTPEASRRTYQHLLDRAETLLRAGWPVVVDATFLTSARREPFLELARELRVDSVILDIDAPEEVLRQRIRDRAAKGRDPSEADETVLDHQLEQRERVASGEATRVLTIDTTRERDGAVLWRRVGGLDE